MNHSLLYKNYDCPQRCIYTIITALMATRYTKTKKYKSTPFGSTKGQKVILVILGILAVGILVSATRATFFYFTESKHSVGSTLAPYVAINELRDPAHFMKQYLHVNCNETIFNHTQSIRLSGIITDGEHTRNFTLTKKRPSLMRLKMDQGPIEITTSVNGEQVWQRIRSVNQEDQITILTGKEAKPWLQQSRFYDSIISAHQGYGHIDSIETTEYDSKTYLQVFMLNAEKKEIEILVDPSTMHPFAEIHRTEDQTERVLFSDFQSIDGMPIPFRIERYIDGVYDLTTTIESGAINIGVLSDYFTLPDPHKSTD